MKSVILFETSWCPHCKKAHDVIEELQKENPSYKKLDIQVIDEEKQPEIAKQFDYYYVPTIYVDGVKAHEGVMNKEIIKGIFDEAI